MINEYLQVILPFSPHLSSNFLCISFNVKQGITSGKHGQWQVRLTYIIITESVLKINASFFLPQKEVKAGDKWFILRHGDGACIFLAWVLWPLYVMLADISWFFLAYASHMLIDAYANFNWLKESTSTLILTFICISVKRHSDLGHLWPGKLLNAWVVKGKHRW